MAFHDNIHSTMSFRSVMVLAAVTVVTGIPSVQAQQSFLIDAGPCLALTTPVERLACFEDQVRAAESLRGVAPAVVREPAAPAPAAPQAQVAAPVQQNAAAPGASVPAASAEANFGLREKPSREERKEELLAKVASVREFAPGRLMVTLENGQVWRQTRAERYNLREGHEARIYATRWGDNYRLSVKELGGFIQVERVE